MNPERRPSEWPRGWAGQREAMRFPGLRLTPAERLRWLEETLAAMRRWLGKAAAERRPPPRP